MADFPISYSQKKPQFWYSTIQGMIGKLYVLSLYYIMYDTTSFFTSESHTDFLMYILFPLRTQKRRCPHSRVNHGLRSNAYGANGSIRHVFTRHPSWWRSSRMQSNHPDYHPLDVHEYNCVVTPVASRVCSFHPHPPLYLYRSSKLRLRV